MKKICLIVQEYYPKDFRVRRIAESLIRRNARVDIISLRNENEEANEIINDVKVNRINFQKKRGSIIRYIFEYVAFTFLAFFKCTYLYFKNKYDIIVINNPPDFLVFSALIPKLCGAKIVIDLHEIVYEDFEERFNIFGKKVFLSIIKLTTFISLKFASRHITVNDTLVNLYEDRIRPEHPVAIVMNSVDETQMLKNRSVNGRPFSLMYHGTLSKHYGVDEVIKALSIVVKKGYKPEMHILGDGIEMDNLKELTRSLGLQDYINFHGYVSRDTIQQYLNSINLGVIPTKKSNYTDLSLSNKFLECIYFEVPTIASNINTYQYYFPEKCVTYFKSGNIEDLAEKIEYAINNYDEMQQKAKKAYDIYDQNYNWNKMIETYWNVLMN